jgi:hypothetical protein
MNLYGEFIRFVEKMQEHKIPYIVIGGLAVSYHVRIRATEDLDFLVLVADVEKIRAIMRDIGYLIETPPWTFRNTGLTVRRFSRFEGEEHMIIDIMSSDDPKYTSMVDRAVVADTAAGPVRFATKEDLIFLKKQRNSPQDQLDIAELQK